MTVTTSARTVQRWTLPSELAGMVPRDVQLSPAGRVVAALAAALIVAAFGAALGMSVAVAAASAANAPWSTPGRWPSKALAASIRGGS